MIWRDKANRNAVFVWLFLTAIALLFLRFTRLSPWIIVVFLAASSLSLFLITSQRRAKQISRLSSSVREVLAGNDHLDFGQYKEGELYILAADLQKIAGAYRQQAAALRRDKAYLYDAISDISHQLKTPITSLFVISEVLRDELSATEKASFEWQLNQQIERLDWLVKSLLTLAKLDADAVVFRKEPTTLGKIARLALSPLAIKADLADLQVEIKGDTKTTLNVDENWLVEALGNVIKNAIEHAAEKSTIDIICQDLPMSKQIAVHNKGVIRTEELAHLFDRFYKRPGADKDSIGIGLSITKAIVQAQGGQVEAVSKDHQTIFHLRFPK